MGAEIYDEDYFLRGKETGKSLYENYRYLPELSVPMCHAISDHLGLLETDVVLDYGCARGYVVKAFREALHIEAYGVDISQWAIDNCDDAVDGWVSCTDKIPPGMDWIIAKDVLEHVPNVADVISEMLESAKQGVFAVVPLALFDGQKYVVEEYELDITHVHRLSLATWARMFMRPGWEVTGSYMVPGVKANYQTWEWGNGFLVARRQ